MIVGLIILLVLILVLALLITVERLERKVAFAAPASSTYSGESLHQRTQTHSLGQSNQCEPEHAWFFSENPARLKIVGISSCPGNKGIKRA